MAAGELPAQVTMTVQEVDVYVKGDTASASGKGATLENGLRISVPVFVQAGERVIVDTKQRTFVRREGR